MPGIYLVYQILNCIYMVYTWYIKSIWTCHRFGLYIPCKNLMGLFSTFFYNDIPVIYHEYPLDKHDVLQVYHYKKKVRNKSIYILLGIPSIWMMTPYAFDIPCIYIPCIHHTYTCKDVIYQLYTWHIHSICILFILCIYIICTIHIHYIS